MSQAMICPTCGQIFDGEDYCPDDGTSLQPMSRPAPRPATPSARAADAAQPGQAGKSVPTAAERVPARAKPEPVSAAAEVPGIAAPEQTRPEDIAPDSPETAMPPHTGSPETPSAPGGPSPTNDQAPRESKLADFMSRLGLRRAQPRDGASDHPEAPRTDEVDARVSPLPEEVVAQGWRLAGPVRSTAAVDTWPIQRDPAHGEPEHGAFHRFRTGALTSSALYRRLHDREVPGLERLMAYGTVDLGGSRADYEIMAATHTGQTLQQWLTESTPSERRAQHLLPFLAAWLRALCADGVQPMTIDPAQLVLTKENALWLTTAATLTGADAHQDYRPELERSALLSRIWSAPELTQQGLISPHAVVFSLGQILAQALWGEPCSHADLQVGAAPFGSIVDGHLARLLMGCLWPRPLERWTIEQFLLAAAGNQAATLPTVPPWDALVPGAASRAFTLAGTAFWRLENLLEAAVKPANWSEATTRLDALLDWAEQTPWKGRIELMRDALEQGRSADWVLCALTRTVRPEAPLTWRHLDVSDEEAERSLARLAQRALRGIDGEVATLRALFQADLRGAFAQTVAEGQSSSE